jgi:hypothetical protein
MPLIPDPAVSSLATAADTPAQGLLCKQAIAGAETAMRIPDLFLSAIGRVESGRALSQTGQLTPWPWTVDAEGQGSFYASKAAAIAAVQALQARGVRSIDVGCLQVNLEQHPEAFGSLDQAFDPQANANFAARLLASLFVQTGSWPLAAAAYHSQTPGVGAPYQQRVLAAWATPDRPPAGRRQVAPAAVQKAEAPAEAEGGGGAGGPVTVFNRSLRAAPDPAAPQGFATRGRGLDAYRQYPVRLAMRISTALRSTPAEAH